MLLILFAAVLTAVTIIEELHACKL